MKRTLAVMVGLVLAVGAGSAARADSVWVESWEATTALQVGADFESAADSGDSWDFPDPLTHTLVASDDVQGVSQDGSALVSLDTFGGDELNFGAVLDAWLNTGGTNAATASGSVNFTAITTPARLRAEIRSHDAICTASLLLEDTSTGDFLLSYSRTDEEPPIYWSFDDEITLQAGHSYTFSWDLSMTPTLAGQPYGGLAASLELDPLPPPAVPEPGTLALVGLGAIGLAWHRRRGRA